MIDSKTHLAIFESSTDSISGWRADVLPAGVSLPHWGYPNEGFATKNALGKPMPT